MAESPLFTLITTILVLLLFLRLMHLFFTALGLHCSTEGFSSQGELGLSARTSHWGDLSSCGAWVSGALAQ